MTSLKDDKYVKVMCDFAAHGIWSRDGSLADLNELPVDANTFFRLGVWAHWFESRKHDDPIPNLERFVTYGKEIALDIKAQLPDWTVIYVDELTAECEPPVYSYEITEGERYNRWKGAVIVKPA